MKQEEEEDFQSNLTGDKEKQDEAKLRWFRRIKKGILTSTSKRNTGRILVKVPAMQLHKYICRPARKPVCMSAL